MVPSKPVCQGLRWQVQDTSFASKDFLTAKTEVRQNILRQEAMKPQLGNKSWLKRADVYTASD